MLFCNYCLICNAIIGLYFLILAIIEQIFNTIIELIILLEISIKEAKEEMEIHLLTAKTKLRKCSMQFTVV